MEPMLHFIPYGVVFWAVFLWAFIPEFAIVRRAGRAARAPDSPDAGSVRVISMGMNAAFVVAVALAWVRVWRFPAAWEPAAYWVGLAMLIAGALLRRHCWRMLGASFTGDVRAHADQEVVTRGAYRYVRHPSYTAGTLMNVGIGVVMGNWASVLVLAAGSLLVYTYRMNVEERALVAALGDRYASFMRGRKRMIPFFW